MLQQNNKSRTSSTCYKYCCNMLHIIAPKLLQNSDAQVHCIIYSMWRVFWRLYLGRGVSYTKGCKRIYNIFLYHDTRQWVCKFWEDLLFQWLYIARKLLKVLIYLFSYPFHSGIWAWPTRIHEPLKNYLEQSVLWCTKIVQVAKVGAQSIRSALSQISLDL